MASFFVLRVVVGVAEDVVHDGRAAPDGGADEVAADGRVVDTSAKIEESGIIDL
jgi:hypothetical protein